MTDTADRPGFADSPVLLGRGHLQIESGFTSEHEGDREQSLDARTWPQLELHAGVSSRFDVSVVWDGLVSSTVTTGSGREEEARGSSDFRVGGKLRLVHRPRLDAALVGYLNVPVGSTALSSRYADPFARLAWGVAVSDRIGISGTGDLKAVREDGRVQMKPAAGAALASSIHGALDGFVGLAAEPRAFGSKPAVVSVETGLVLAVGTQTQIDVWVSNRITGDPDGWFVSAGFVRRLR